MSESPYLAANSQSPHELSRGAQHTYLFITALRAYLSRSCEEGRPCMQTLVLGALTALSAWPRCASSAKLWLPSSTAV